MTRYDKAASGSPRARRLGGFQRSRGRRGVARRHDLRRRQRGAPPSVKRFDANGKLLKIDQGRRRARPHRDRRRPRLQPLDDEPSASATSTKVLARPGKLLGTATSGDLIAQDVAVGPKGDLYAYDQRPARHRPLRRGPVEARDGRRRRRSRWRSGVAKVKYTLSGDRLPRAGRGDREPHRRRDREGHRQGGGRQVDRHLDPAREGPASGHRRSSRSCSRRTAARRRRRPSVRLG